MMNLNADILDNKSLKQHLLKELDIYIPELSLAVEYDGDYWHDDKRMMETRGLTNNQAHIIKQELCKQAGIELIFITEHGWLNDSESVKKNLEGIIGNHISMINH